MTIIIMDIWYGLQIITFVSGGKTLGCTTHCPQGIYMNVILQCWKLHPDDRISPKELVRNIRDCLRCHLESKYVC